MTDNRISELAHKLALAGYGEVMRAGEGRYPIDKVSEAFLGILATERDDAVSALEAERKQRAVAEVALQEAIAPGCHVCGRDGDEAPSTEHLCDHCSTQWRADIARLESELDEAKAMGETAGYDAGHRSRDAEFAEMKTTALEALERVRALEGELAQAQGMLGLDTPWPLRDVLERLADAADHLLSDHNCDADQWEGVAHARDSARGLLEMWKWAALPAAPSAQPYAQTALCECGHRYEGHVVDGYCLGCKNCAAFRLVDAEPAPTSSPGEDKRFPFGGLCSCAHASNHTLPHEPGCVGYPKPADEPSPGDPEAPRAVGAT